MLKQMENLIKLNYNFIKFNEILKKIRNSFITELEITGLLDEVRFNSRLCKKILRHCVLEEILRCHVHLDFSKINVILIEPASNHVLTDELFDETEFISTVIKIVDSCKRKIPILIKKYNGEDFESFLMSGEGEHFLVGIISDKDRLRKSVCTFREFKIFARNNGLRYILDEILEDVKFKSIFMS